jgi:hypothetical protein
MPLIDALTGPLRDPENGEAFSSEEQTTMRSAARSLLAVAASACAVSGFAQAPVASPRPGRTGEAPPDVPGYIATVRVEAIARDLRPTGATAPEAEAMLGMLRGATSVVTRVHLAQDLSRHEIVSADFALPAGTVVLHRAGDKAYVIADPGTKTYAVMDAETLLEALEGGAGIVNSQYSARVAHTDERRTIAGLPARKSVVSVSYVTSMPLENDKILVRQKNDIEVWHTSGLTSAAATDHFFFKFQRDKTGEVQRAMDQEIGFPLDVKMVVTQEGAGPRARTAQPGSVHAVVTELTKEPKLDSSLFRIPPAGYRRVDRLPFFAAPRPAAAN